jgi:hypothetical protein
MRQHTKRGDLTRLNVMIPKELNDWIYEVCEKTQESRGIVVTKFLEMVKIFQKSLEKS